MKPNKKYTPILRLLIKPALAAAMLFLAEWAGQAADITFNPSVTISGVADVPTNGLVLAAYTWGTAESVNGIAFAASTATSGAVGSYISLSGFTTANGTAFYAAGTDATLPAVYTNILRGAVYGAAGTTATVTLMNLIPGHQYAVQVWVQDPRSADASRQETIINTDGTGGQLMYFNAAKTGGGVGQYCLGTFTATAATQPFQIAPASTSPPQFSSIELLDVTVGNWSGLAGATLDNTSLNFCANLLNAPLVPASLTTVQGLTSAVVFGDSFYSNSIAFPVGTANLTVAAGGVSPTGIYFANNSSNYIFNSADASGITGGGLVELVGGGNVYFNGPNTYTGNTILNAGRLVLGNSGAVGGSANIILNGGALDASALTSLPLNSGQTLSGAGTVYGSVTAATGATITLGVTGNLAVTNNLTLNGQAFTFNLGDAPGRGNKITVGGALTLNGNSVITLNELAGFMLNGTYTLFTFASKSGGAFSLDRTYPGIVLNNNSTNVTLTVTGGIAPGGTSSVWVTPTGGNWTTPTNWQGSIIATNTDGLADFSTLMLPGNETVNVNSTNITIGYMAFGDVGHTYQWTLTGGTNTLARSSGSPTFLVATNMQANINSVLAGSQGFTVEGPGILVLGGANTVTNGINVVNGGSLAITSAKGLSSMTVPANNPVILSNGFFEFATSGAQYFTNNLNLLGNANITNTIYQGSSAQDSFVGAISGSGVLNIQSPGGVVFGQRGDMSGFTGTVLVTGNASGNNAGGFILANGDNTSGISGSANATWDFEGCTLNYLYSGSPMATNYMGALMGNNANAIIQCKNGAGTTTGGVTTEIGALNLNTTFAGTFRDYANVNTGTAPPQLSIRKVGIGTLTLAGNNINTGPTEVRGGRLVLSGAFTAPITVDSGAICEIDGSVNSSTVTANSGGTLLVGNGASLGTAVVTANGLMDVSPWSGSFNLNSASLTGSGLINGTVTLSGSGYLNPGTIGDAGILTITNGDLVTQGGVMEFDLSTTNSPASGNDLLMVYGNMDFSAGGTISISRIQGYISGGTNILAQCTGSVVGSVANLTLVGANAQDYLQIDGTNLELVVYPTTLLSWTGNGAGNLWDINGSVNWLAGVGSSVYTNGCGVSFDSAGLTNPIVTIPATVTPSVVLVSGNTNYTLVGSGDISGSTALIKTGTNTLTILNTNTFTGAVYLKAGTLAVGNASTNGQLASNLRTSSGASLIWTTPISQLMTNVISGAATLLKQGAGTLTLVNTNTLSGATTISAGALELGDGYSADGLLGTGGLTNNGQVLLMEPYPATLSNSIAGNGGIDNSSSASVILAGAISGTGKLTNDYGAGNLYLTASNSYSGGTVVNNGTVVVSDPTLHGLGSGNVVINDGTGAIWFSAGGTNIVANSIQLPPDTTADQFLLSGATTVRLTGWLTGGASGQITRLVNVSAGGDNRGVILLDNPTNTFTTVPEVYFGTLAFTSDGALGNSTNCISVNVGNKPNTQFYSLASDGLTFAANNIALNASRAINLVGTENINVQSYNGTINGPVTGNGLIKLGTGTLTLNGAGSLTNSTTVSAGTLVVNNTWTGTNVTVSSSATLSGGGTINAAIQIGSGGTLAPGIAAPTILNVTSNLLFAAGGTAHMNINAGTVTCDRVAGMPALTYGGTLTVTNLGGTVALGQSYQLFSAVNYSGSFAATNLPVLSGLAWNWNPASGTLSVISGVATNPTNLTATVSSGSLKLSWPADHTGWRLLVQTNHLLTGISSNTNDWGTVAGSAATNQMTIPIDVTKPTEFYRLAYP